MRTRSVDMAAYLHLNGLEPNDVRFDEKWRVREYRYKDSPTLRSLVKAFENDALVPAKAFGEARAMMKKRSPSKAISNYRKAVGRAVEDVLWDD